MNNVVITIFIASLFGCASLPSNSTLLDTVNSIGLGASRAYVVGKLGAPSKESKEGDRVGMVFEKPIRNKAYPAVSITLDEKGNVLSKTYNFSQVGADAMTESEVIKFFGKFKLVSKNVPIPESAHYIPGEKVLESAVDGILIEISAYHGVSQIRWTRPDTRKLSSSGE